MSSSQSMAKTGSSSLFSAGRLSQIWNSSSGLGSSRSTQREHLRVDDAATGGEPLHVAPPEAGGGAERVRVVDEALADVGDGLEAAVGVLGEAGHHAAVVHPPAVDAGEVHARCRAPRAWRAGPSWALPAG